MKKKKQLTILGLDPGTKNFGASVVRVTFGDRWVYEILYSGVLIYPMHSLVGDDAGQHAELFRTEIDTFVTKFNVDMIVAERFQARGLRGKTIELVSFMLGVLEATYLDKIVLFITAATWKNRWNALTGNDLKALYLDNKDVPPHEWDASAIALFGASLYDSRRTPFSFVNARRFIEKVKAVSQSRKFRIAKDTERQRKREQKAQALRDKGRNTRSTARCRSC